MTVCILCLCCLVLLLNLVLQWLFVLVLYCALLVLATEMRTAGLR